MNILTSARSLVRLIPVLMLLAPAAIQAAKITAQINNSLGESVTNAGVYANMLSGTAPVKPKREISIEQINKEFVPLVSIAQTGALVNFPNRDPIRHHVYSFSPAKSFEIKLYSGVPSKPVAFDKPGEVVLGCNIHDTMIAYVLVVDTPYFAKADSQGRAVLDGLPAGEYEVHMWYPGGAATPPSQKIRLGTAGNSEIRFTFSSKPLSPRSTAAPATSSGTIPAAGK